MHQLVLACWDQIVPEYEYHQLSHMVALALAEELNKHESMHGKTWLIDIPTTKRIEHFLRLAEELDICSPKDLGAWQKIS